MIDYQEFNAQFVRENKILKKAIAVTLVMNSIILGMVIFQRQYFVYQGGPIFREKPLMEDVCLSSFSGILKDTPNVHEVTPEILKVLKKEPFTMTVEKIHQVIALSGNSCKIILKADGKLQSYKIIMKASESYPLHFKLSEIVELTLNKEEL